MSRATTSKTWKIGWRLIVCGLLMVWILHAIFLNEGKLAFTRQHRAWDTLTRWQQWQAAWTYGPAELWSTLTVVHTGAAVLSVVCMGLTIFLGVVRWRMVLKAQGLDLSLGRATEISFVAHFFNSFLLGSTGGDLMKAYYAARETHHKKPEAVATVFADRLLGLFAMLLFAGIMMVPNLHLILAHKRLAALSAFTLLMLLGCAGVIVVSFWGGVIQRGVDLRGWLRKLPKGAGLERSLDACRELGKRPRFLLEVLGVSMVLNAVCVLQYMALSTGMNLSISPGNLFVIVPMIICIAALPITPSGLGVRENLYVWILAVPEINVGETSALSLSLLAYAGSLLWSLVGGVVYATLKEKHHLAEVARDTPEPAAQ